MLVRGSALAAVLALVATLMLASTAGAQHSVEVLREGDPSTPCSPFAMSEHRPVEGDCTVQFTGSIEIWIHNGLSEVLVSDCDYEFEAVFNSIGFGYLYDQVMTPEGDPCLREPCDEGVGGGGPGVAPHRNIPWQAQINETAPGVEELRVVLCQRNFSSDPATEGTPGTYCVADLTIETAGHAQELVSAPDFLGNGGSPCINYPNQVAELEANLNSQTNEDHPDQIEITHLDD